LVWERFKTKYTSITTTKTFPASAIFDFGLIGIDSRFRSFSLTINLFFPARCFGRFCVGGKGRTLYLHSACLNTLSATSILSSYPMLPDATAASICWCGLGGIVATAIDSTIKHSHFANTTEAGCFAPWAAAGSDACFGGF
jgi:hypothetical protein